MYGKVRDLETPKRSLWLLQKELKGQDQKQEVYCLKTQASDCGNSGNEDGEKWVVLREIKKIKTQRFWRLSVAVRESRMTPRFLIWETV